VTGYVRNLISQTGLRAGRRSPWPLSARPVAGRDHGASGVRPLETDVEAVAAPPVRAPARRRTAPPASVAADSAPVSEGAPAPVAREPAPAPRGDERPSRPAAKPPVVKPAGRETDESRIVPRKSAAVRRAEAERPLAARRPLPTVTTPVEPPRIVQESEIAAPSPEPPAPPTPEDRPRQQPPSWTMRELRRWLAATPDPQEVSPEARPDDGAPVEARPAEDRRRPPQPRRPAPKQQEKEGSLTIGSIELIVESEPAQPTQPAPAPAVTERRAADTRFALRRHYLQP
jgi:hypothetical protein